MNTKLKTQLNKFFKQTFAAGFLFSVSAFIFIRVMIYPLPIELAEDCLIFMKTVLTGWLLVMIVKGGFECLVFILEFAQGAIQKYIKSINGNLIISKQINFMWEHINKAYRKVRIEKIEFYSEAVNATEVAK